MVSEEKAFLFFFLVKRMTYGLNCILLGFHELHHSGAGKHLQCLSVFSKFQTEMTLSLVDAIVL